MQENKRSRIESIKKKKEQQAAYKNELIKSGALEGGKRVGGESLEDKEFLLNRSIIKDYIHVN